MDFEKAMRDAAKRVQTSTTDVIVRDAMRLVPPRDESAPQTRLQYDLQTRRLPRNHPGWRG